jgi:hypothetical protein
MQEYKHWASELQVGDRAVATIRHQTDGTKNIHNAVVVVVANNEFNKNIKGALAGTLFEIPYNELKQYDPHEASMVSCDICTHEWVAVRPAGLTKLQCPNCLKVAHFENVG